MNVQENDVKAIVNAMRNSKERGMEGIETRNYATNNREIAAGRKDAVDVIHMTDKATEVRRTEARKEQKPKMMLSSDVNPSTERCVSKPTTPTGMIIYYTV